MRLNGPNGPPLVDIRDLSKTYQPGCPDCTVLHDIDLTIDEGEFVVLLGVSGSGKSTLLNLISGIDEPSGGVILLEGQDVTRLDERARTLHRRDQIGIVFQFFNLIPTLTALENVALPIQFANRPKFEPEKRARELLGLLGLSDRLNHRPMELSGGQQQRVAIARALANNPPLLLADEPTGNLDSEASEVVLEALRAVWRETGTTVVLVTHDHDLAARMGRVMELVDGRIVREYVPA